MRLADLIESVYIESGNDHFILREIDQGHEHASAFVLYHGPSSARLKLLSFRVSDPTTLRYIAKFQYDKQHPWDGGELSLTFNCRRPVHMDALRTSCGENGVWVYRSGHDIQIDRNRRVEITSNGL